MRVEGVIWLDQIVDKLIQKHSVETYEVEDVLFGKSRLRFVEKGERKDEDVYMALGQTEAGRYLTILFIYKQTREVLVLSARDMATKERKMYARK